MRILYLTLDPPLDPQRIATGNQVRAAALRGALEAAGHQVLQRWPTEGGGSGGRELSPGPDAGAVDAILAGYWTLLEYLPADHPPLVLDFVAPRLLEAIYQGPGELQHESRELLRLLPRADHFLVGNSRQADFLLPLLLLAGFDCRERVPISLLPISVSEVPPPREPGAGEGLRLVSAGVDWPWRRGADFLAAAADFCRGHPGSSLLHLSGGYPGAAGEKGHGGLVGHAEMRRLIAGADIGLELGLRNTEREFSHSFRLAEYLQQGLPVILNSWLPAAPLLLEYGAGWSADTPGELRGLLDELARDPASMREALRQKAAGARRLAEGPLNYRHSCRPLLDWLERPWIPGRDLPVAAAETATPAELRPAGGRFGHAAAELARYLLNRSRPAGARGILMVSRGDLFPPDHGAAVKILRGAEALSRQGRDVWLCTDSRREYYRFHQGEMSRLRYPFWLRLLALPRPVALLRLLLKGMPASNAFLYFPLADASYIFRVLYLGAMLPVGAWLAEFPAYVRPCRFARKLFGGRLVLVEHNVEFERIRQQVPELTTAGYRYLKEREVALCQAADSVVAVSDRDRGALIAAGVDPRKLRTIPHGVDLQGFAEATADDPRARYGIPADHLLLIYHGTYSYPPNLQAMQVMADEILPRLRKLGLAASVLAVGSRPPRESPDPDIRFTGSVENLAQLLPAADLAVVPLLSGGGTRMKILDYFAAGVPVVSTSKGIEGIPVRHGREALIFDDFDALCEAVARLARDREEAACLAKQARGFVQSLGWDDIARRYLPLLFDPAEAPSPAGAEAIRRLSP